VAKSGDRELWEAIERSRGLSKGGVTGVVEEKGSRGRKRSGGGRGMRGECTVRKGGGGRSRVSGGRGQWK